MSLSKNTSSILRTLGIDAKVLKAAAPNRSARRKTARETGTSSAVEEASRLRYRDWIKKQDACPEPGTIVRRFVFYCRFSTTAQHESSIERQLLNNHAYAKRNGFVPAAGRFEYTDRARSGAFTHGREALHDLLADSKLNKFDVVIVEDLDRLARDIGDMGQLIRTLESRGVEMHAATRGRCGNMETAMLGFFATEQRIRTTQITTQGKWLAASEGRNPGIIAFGYRRSKEGPGLLEEHEINGPVVRKIFDWFDSGMSIGNIVVLLNRGDVKSPRGKAWTSRTIAGLASKGAGILRNSKYAGLLVYGKIERRKDPENGKYITRTRHHSQWIMCEDPTIALVDPEQWYRAQDKLDELAPKRVRRAGRKGEFIFKNVTFCTCGALMYGLYIHRTRPRQLVCSAGRVGACTRKRKRTITAHFVERELLRIIRDDIAGPEACERFETEFRAERERISRKVLGDRTRLEKTIADREKSLEKTMDADRTRGFEPDRLQKLREKIQKELREAEDEYERLPRLDELPRLPEGLVAEFRESVASLIGRLPLAELGERELLLFERLRSLLRRVVVRPTPNGGYILEVEGHLAGLLGDAATGVTPVRKLKKTCPPPERGFMKDPDRRDMFAAMAATKDFELQDEDWIAVEPLLGVRRKDAISQRTALNAALFHARTRVPMYVLPAKFGAPSVIGTAVRKLVRSGSLRRALDALESRGSPIVASLDRSVFDRLAEKPRRRRRRGAAPSIRRPPPTVAARGKLTA